jgi:hypothetical protein
MWLLGQMERTRRVNVRTGGQHEENDIVALLRRDGFRKETETRSKWLPHPQPGAAQQLLHHLPIYALREGWRRRIRNRIST